MAACTDAVLKYMVAENRPYSSNDVHQNLHNKFKKPDVQKALESLAERGDLLAKEYGKSKLYCAIQRNAASGEDSGLIELDSSILSVSQNLKIVEQQAREADALLKELESTPTTEDAESEAVAYETRLQRLRTKLAELTDNCIKVSPEDRQKIISKHETLLRLYRKRKKLCNNILNVILENSQKSRADFIEEIGIETDEAANFILG